MKSIKNFFKMWYIPLLLVIIMAGCDERDGLISPPAITVPTVSSTQPANSATEVPINQKIAANFSEVMDSSTMTTATFTIMQGTTFISGTVTYTGVSAIFSPSTNLEPNTLFLATITTMAKSAKGQSLAQNYVWSFTTGADASITAPKVSSTDPANAATGVPINQKIAAFFSTGMDATTITASTFTLRQGTTPVPGFVSFSGITAIFSPSNNLLPNTAYTATITTGAKDLAGNAIEANYTWSYTTGAAAVITPPTISATDPANLETGVALNQRIAATFSKTMDASTITTATFTLMQGTTFVSGTVSYSGMMAIYTPSSNLVANTDYTATITTGAKDLSGNPVVSNYVWTFKTGLAPVVEPPMVSSTDPANVASNVALNQKIAATFSKTMDATTITSSTFILRQGITPVPGFVSYFGRTALYAPAVNLLPNTVYTAVITTGAVDLSGIPIETNYSWNFTTGSAVVITPPEVSSIDPLNGAVNVPLNQKIAATFSKTMDASTLTSASFILRQGSTSVSGFVSYNGTTALFAPSANLDANTEYTATITTGAKDLAGNALVNNFVWSFTTGSAPVIIPPVVNSTDPAHLATGVALNQKIAASFSKTMNSATITTATFFLRLGNTPVSGFVSYSGTTGTFTPASNLLPNSVYTVTITTGAKDLAGNALVEQYVWTFTTGAAVVITRPTVSSTDPLNLATNVPLNQKIAAMFSKTMDASTITASTFLLKQGSNPVAGFVSYSGTTAIFSPTSNLMPNTVYNATITTGAKDLAGNELLNDYNWSFTTGAATVVTPPTVTSTEPANLATGVPLNQKVAAVFSKTMNATTLTSATFTLKQAGVSVSGFVSYSGTTAIFAPASNLLPNTLYTATITTGAEDLSGNPLASNYVFTFTTGNSTVVVPPTVTSTDPLNNATGVALDKRVTAVFSKLMDASTITTGSYTLMEGNLFVAGTVSYSGTTATFVPSNNLKSFTVYTATITTTVKDLAGNSLQANYVWSFTTGNSYTVSLSSNPVDGGTTSGAGTFFTGSTVTVNATANSGFAFTNWTENGVIVSTNASYQFVITANRTLVANFLATVYTVAVSSNPLDAGSASGSGNYNSGSSVTVSAVANAGFAFTNWTENGLVVSTNANYQFTIIANRVLVANFNASIFTVGVSANPSAGGTASGGGNYNGGSMVTVEAVANSGYVFTNWTDNGNVVSNNSSYSFTITENRVLVANFVVGSGGLPVNLRSAARFAILSHSAITNIPASSITGDVGISPGSRGAITGLTNPEVIGTIFAADDPAPTPAMLIQAKTDANLAYLDAISATRGVPTPISGNLNGLTLVPGLYESGTSIEISAGGILFLDAQGDPNAVFVIRSATSITTLSSSEVRLSGGAQAKNIFWAAGSSVTLGTGSIMKGTLIAGTSISLLTGSRLDGRALIQGAAAGQISLDASIVVRP
ncbi:MAG: Ig-like domain-containing protein [Ignavibacteriaceae bacterium]|nr:Ig-like domain-containing protein [Ignavibacteriaceae bacterium]